MRALLMVFYSLSVSVFSYFVKGAKNAELEDEDDRNAALLCREDPNYMQWSALDQYAYAAIAGTGAAVSAFLLVRRNKEEGIAGILLNAPVAWRAGQLAQKTYVSWSRTSPDVQLMLEDHRVASR